jgi:hypothetical protein
MQLREPVALAASISMTGRVGNVDAHLDHARGDEHVGIAAGELSIAAAFCFDGSCPWISSTRRSANSVVRRRSNSAVAALA